MEKIGNGNLYLKIPDGYCLIIIDDLIELVSQNIEPRGAIVKLDFVSRQNGQVMDFRVFVHGHHFPVQDRHFGLEKEVLSPSINLPKLHST
jgi:hypothetical protein